VGDKVQQENIHAKFEDGTLRLTIPKVIEVPQVEQKNLIAIEG
jgi:HSP20 family molecular chaperone IbpA